MDANYIDAVRLLLEAIPVVFQEPRFAMKGGTALNLFVQDHAVRRADSDRSRSWQAIWRVTDGKHSRNSSNV